MSYAIELWSKRGTVSVPTGELRMEPWEGDPEWNVCVLGSARDLDDICSWMGGAYRNGLLPDPPSYEDELRIYRVKDRERSMTFRLGWVEVQPAPQLVRPA